MAKFKPVIRKGDKRQDGTTNIKIRVSHQRKVSYLPTEYYVLPEEFDDTEGKVKPISITENEAEIINLRLIGLIGKYANKLLPLGERAYTMDIKSVMRILRDKNEKYDFYSLLEEKIRELDSIDNVGYSGVFKRTRELLRSYYGQSTLMFEAIDPEWLKRLEVKMKVKKHSPNSIGIHMRNIRTIYNQAISMGLVELGKYPFRRYQIPKGRVVKRNNTLEEMVKIKNVDLEDKLMAWARDMYMLSFYLIGINMKDMMFLKEIEEGRVYYIRSKGKKNYSIEVQPEALQIIHRYKGKKYLLNIMENYSDYRTATKRINKKLKGVAEKCGIEKPITTYYARHTWATIASRLGIGRDTIRYALGHSLNTVTDIYIDYDQEIVDKANRKVIDSLIIKKTGPKGSTARR